MSTNTNNDLAKMLYNFIGSSEVTGESTFDLWRGLGNEGGVTEFLEYIRNDKNIDKTQVIIESGGNLVIKESLIIHLMESKEEYENIVLSGNFNENEIYLVPDEYEFQLMDSKEEYENIVLSGNINENYLYLVPED